MTTLITILPAVPTVPAVSMHWLLQAQTRCKRQVTGLNIQLPGREKLLRSACMRRPLSKTVRFNVLRVQHAGPASKVKKGFTNF